MMDLRASRFLRPKYNVGLLFPEFMKILRYWTFINALGDPTKSNDCLKWTYYLENTTLLIDKKNLCKDDLEARNYAYPEAIAGQPC